MRRRLTSEDQMARECQRDPAEPLHALRENLVRWREMLGKYQLELFE